MLQHVRERDAQIELAEPLLEDDPDDHQIDAAFEHLVDDRRADVARLEQIGVNRHAEALADLFGVVQQILAALGLFLKLGVKRKRALHLDDVNRVDLGLRLPSDLASELEDFDVRWVPFDRNQYATCVNHAPKPGLSFGSRSIAPRTRRASVGCATCVELAADCHAGSSSTPVRTSSPTLRSPGIRTSRVDG